MFRFKTFTLILHLAGWLLFLMFPLLFLESGADADRLAVFYSFPYLQFCLCYIVLFYLNSYYLIPQFFIRKNYRVYFLILGILLIGVFSLRPFDKLISSRMEQTRMANGYAPPGDGYHPEFNTPPNGFSPGGSPDGKFKPWPPEHAGRRMLHHTDINSLLIFVLIVAFSMSLRSVEQWQITEKRAIVAEGDKAIAELSFLKAQINPHFLYNTLNNIYTLSLIGSDKTSESIMKLSNIMRYVTDEAESDFVLLENELSCVNNFIDLQKLRLGKKVTLNYTVDGDPLQYKIAPLLFMTFIENVFKYGLSNHHPAQIDIHIQIDEDAIVFHSQNQKFKTTGYPRRVGIGILNTKKRLAYLYPQKHVLTIEEDEHAFKVDLILYS
jgi:two-component system LytT family sensor kinase